MNTRSSVVKRSRREANSSSSRTSFRQRGANGVAASCPSSGSSSPSHAKALTKAIRQTFGRHTPIQRCQVHKARNIVERLPKHLHVSVRKALRQAWELDDADKAERLIRNLARRLEREAPGVALSILEGLDEILTVTRLGLPMELRRSLACTNIIENMNGTIRRVCGNSLPSRRRGSNAGEMPAWRSAGPPPA